MDVIFSALYRMVKDDALQVMPAPCDRDTPHALWEAERVVEWAPHLGRAGFTHFLWPPLTMSQGGSAANADGYGKQYDLNVGQWRPTRWGTAEQVLAANQALHKAGLKVLEDAVIHQYAGSAPFFELGSDGRVDKTLFPKLAGCFVPNVPADDVFDAEGNQAFGLMVSYQNSTPPGYMLHGVTEACAWRRDRLALDGGRLDDTKGENANVSQRLMERVGGYWFGECFTGSPDELEAWVEASGGKRTLDFTFHWAAKEACEGGSFRRWVNNGLWARDPEHSVLFVDTADTDGNNDENVRFNKLWAYFRGLMIPATAMLIYSGDYLPERYGLRRWIDNMIWISRMFAFGAMSELYVDDTFIVWSRDGEGGEYGWSGGLLCAMNADPMNRRGTWVPTPFGPNRHLHNYASTWGPDIWTNSDGWAYVETGPNVNGAATSYVAYSPAGVDQQIPVTPVVHRPKGSLTDFSNITARG